MSLLRARAAGHGQHRPEHGPAPLHNQLPEPQTGVLPSPAHVLRAVERMAQRTSVDRVWKPSEGEFGDSNKSSFHTIIGVVPIFQKIQKFRFGEK